MEKYSWKKNDDDLQYNIWSTTSPLQYNIWIKLPEGFTDNKGCSYAKLRRSLYGLVQASSDWYLLQEAWILDYDKRFVKSRVEPCLYHIITDTLVCIILVHVDDYAIACNDPEYTKQFLAAFGKRFEITNLGRIEQILQMRLTWGSNFVELDQQRQISELALQYGQSTCHPPVAPMDNGLHLKPAPVPDPAFPYRSLFGSLLWIARCTRPDIMYAVAYLSHFLSSFGQQH